VGPDGKFYGVLGGRFVSYVPGEEPQTILERGADDRDWALNDVALSAIGLAYVTTLKDPDKGRLSIVNVAQQSIAVAYDGEDVPELSNPNGVAVSPDGKFLVLGVSHYKDRKKSGVHRFPIRNDGSVDVDAGRKSKWADISAPDGIAFGPNGWLYATAGGQVVAVDEHGKKMMEIKIPQGSGTNLTFGGEDGLTLYVTTDKALYATRVAPPDA
jgi:sugar lactone lactonase YvrE